MFCMVSPLSFVELYLQIRFQSFSFTDSKVFVTISEVFVRPSAQISCGGGASSGVFSLATEFLIDSFLTWK